MKDLGPKQRQNEDGGGGGETREQEGRERRICGDFCVGLMHPNLISFEFDQKLQQILTISFQIVKIMDELDDFWDED